MGGLYVYSAIAAAALLALSIWTWPVTTFRRPDKWKLLFFSVDFILWVGSMIGFYSSFQVPVRVIARQNGKFTPPAAPSNKGSSSRSIISRAASSEPVRARGPGKRRSWRRGKRPSGPLAGYDQWTAVYDISAHTVYLPNGTTLEAHSGLGDRLDDPRHVRERMRGATPPDVYELALREQLFHGVQALRLKPVGGGNVFGRGGSPAHTYMLGPNGHSNGCVVFKNYEAFLQAFQNGEVKRLVVVAHLD